MSLPVTLEFTNTGTVNTDTLWYFFGKKWPILEWYIQQGEYKAFQQELLQFFESNSEQYTTSLIIELLQNIINLLPKKPTQWIQWVFFAIRRRTWFLRKEEEQEIQILNAFASLLEILQTGKRDLFSWKNIANTLRDNFELWCHQSSSIYQ